MKHVARRLLLTCLCASGAMRGSAQTSSTPTPTTQDSVTVTADRGLAGINDSATSTATLSAEQMQQQPGLTLDDELHQVAGFMLYRRTSSWTANPTTEGVSLRGLGSTAASRTLVVSDEVPLNDPFGGWIHWDEIPALAISQVQLERGGASDLYGSSAIGGVINVLPAQADSPHNESLLFSADAAGASEDSANQNALLSTASKRLAFLGAESFLTTGGYIPTAPSLRGLVDIPSNVTSEAGRMELRGFALQQKASAFLRGNVLNEARSNGTPLQTNGTRLWRYTAGADADTTAARLALRFYGAREAYRQSFSSIATDRNSETLTKLQKVPLDQLGLVAQAARALPHEFTAAVGFDIDDVRATDNEAGVSKGAVTGTTSTSARQRETGGFVDAIWTPRAWSLSGSVRVDNFHTYDAQQVVSTTGATAQLPNISELVASPRVGIVSHPQSGSKPHAWPRGLALTATAFRAFRGPTMNELYRTGQVGQQTTLANSSLLAERATGAEGGIELDRRVGHLRATYFWTEVNRPISTVVLSQTATTQTLQRQNLGQIQSRGMMIEAQSKRWRGFDASVGYQLAVATVTAFNTSSPLQANLTGKWIPQVPREMATATANYTAPHVASFHAIASYTGQAFDDSSNQFLLHPYARFDVSADRSLTHGLSLFAGAQNLLNRSIDAGRTPILTLASPRLVEGGVRYTFRR